MHRDAAGPAAVVQGWAALTVEVAPRVAPILLLLRAAATVDAELATLLREVDDRRLVRMTGNAGRLAAGGHLRPGLDVAKAGELLWTYSSPELYELLVVKLGWSPTAYGAFVGEALLAALLPGRGR